MRKRKLDSEEESEEESEIEEVTRCVCHKSHNRGRMIQVRLLFNNKSYRLY